MANKLNAKVSGELAGRQAVCMIMALERELETFKRMLPSLAADEGRFALISGDALLGVFDSYSDALRAGYQANGPEKPFLVKRISQIEAVANYTRAIRFECTSQAM